MVTIQSILDENNKQNNNFNFKNKNYIFFKNLFQTP